MGRSQQAAELLRRGNSLANIAQLMGISKDSVCDYLLREVGDGELFRYEILLGIDKQFRSIVERVVDQCPFKPFEAFMEKLRQELKNVNCSWDKSHFLIYITLRDAVYADMCELLRKIETHLHKSIRSVLADKYGEERWWRDGVPENIRTECAAAQEKDAEPVKDKYAYTTLIQLKEICDKQWGIISKALPADVRCGKPKFLSNMARPNRIRNSVMHPVRGRRLEDDDFSFVLHFRDSLGIEY